MTTKANVMARAAMYLCDQRCADETHDHDPDEEGDDREPCPRCKKDVRETYTAIASAIYDSMDMDGLTRAISVAVNKWDRNIVPGGNLGL
jgi:hypothetical protein